MRRQKSLPICLVRFSVSLTRVIRRYRLARDTLTDAPFVAAGSGHGPLFSYPLRILVIGGGDRSIFASALPDAPLRALSGFFLQEVRV